MTTAFGFSCFDFITCFLKCWTRTFVCWLCLYSILCTLDWTCKHHAQFVFSWSIWGDMCSVKMMHRLIRYISLDNYNVPYSIVLVFQISGLNLIWNSCHFRTPLMAAMHEDDSPDLIEVARILNDTFEVNKSDTIFFVPKWVSFL
jgi:hypothetical protein